MLYFWFSIFWWFATSSHFSHTRYPFEQVLFNILYWELYIWSQNTSPSTPSILPSSQSHNYSFSYIILLYVYKFTTYWIHLALLAWYVHVCWADCLGLNNQWRSLSLEEINCLSLAAIDSLYLFETGLGGIFSLHIGMSTDTNINANLVQTTILLSLHGHMFFYHVQGNLIAGILVLWVLQFFCNLFCDFSPQSWNQWL